MPGRSPALRGAPSYSFSIENVAKPYNPNPVVSELEVRPSKPISRHVAGDAPRNGHRTGRRSALSRRGRLLAKSSHRGDGRDIKMEVFFALDGCTPRDVQLRGDARIVYRATMTPETVEGFDPEWVRNPAENAVC